MSLAKFGVEEFLADVQSMLAANLNTKIAAINTEKGDSISLATINASAYILQSLDSEVASFNPFVLYGVTDIETESQGAYSVDIVTAQVLICFEDMGIDTNPTKRCFRYTRALREVIESNWNRPSPAMKQKIKSLLPLTFEFGGNSQPYKAVGIELQVAIG